MLIATSSGVWGYLGYLALVASGFFVLFGARSGQSRKDLNDSVVALQGRLDAKQDEIADLNKKQDTQAALIASQDQQIIDLRASVRTLERVVTGAEAIKDLESVTIRGFGHLQVPLSVLHGKDTS